jgi:hypothetical protein
MPISQGADEWREQNFHRFSRITNELLRPVDDRVHLGGRALPYPRIQRKRYLTFYEDEHPISAQLFGSDPYTLSESAKMRTPV